MRDDPNRALFCVDWEKQGDKINIWGVDHNTNYQYIEIVLVPCNYVHSEFGETGDKITPECLADREKAEDYLENIRAFLLMSEQHFQQDGFDEETIIEQSRFFT